MTSDFSAIIPDGWHKLSFAQFESVCRILASDMDIRSRDTVIFLKLAGLRYIGPVDTVRSEELGVRSAANSSLLTPHSSLRITPHSLGVFTSGKNRLHIIRAQDIAMAADDTLQWVDRVDARLLSATWLRPWPKHRSLMSRLKSLLTPRSSLLTPFTANTSAEFGLLLAADAQFARILHELEKAQAMQSTKFITIPPDSVLYPTPPKRELLTPNSSLLTKIVFPDLKRPFVWHHVAAMLVFRAFKDHIARQYPDLFAAPDPDDNMFGGAGSGTDPASVSETINAQIRALTKGDITAEQRILDSPMRRALTELNQLAREARELKELYKTK